MRDDLLDSQRRRGRRLLPRRGVAEVDLNALRAECVHHGDQLHGHIVAHAVVVGWGEVRLRRAALEVSDPRAAGFLGHLLASRALDAEVVHMDGSADGIQGRLSAPDGLRVHTDLDGLPDRRLERNEVPGIIDALPHRLPADCRDQFI
ncbi:MAG TPA: hypothetical protein DGT21_12250 [Armatimonadetes bacterium]|nr:hypothetical protein [Armatimonadota bacterium]